MYLTTNCYDTDWVIRLDEKTSSGTDIEMKNM